MLHIDRIAGDRADPAWRERIHHLEHHGAVDEVTIPNADMARRRLRITTPKGEDLAIALPRDQKLFDGAVLLADDNRAIVVRAEVERWLRLQPRSIAEAIELGYHAGNLHWRVRFESECLLVALEGPADAYYARLDTLFSGRSIKGSIVTGDIAA
ncbi:urease accessory protein UreE [Hansschlegelia plantiphila]|uniref:Urease accessory protein UreE n=1 Tax=Hansschlegelia plantiphila TaxID=374655 RepID=A0A9W6IXB9_9HYPH|nr:urease accessory protein UreE [Hansschlegelia plantiphila]GLK66885.1 urease accessory protein UreE 1 [Hansschlegelia plantiphila]